MIIDDLRLLGANHRTAPQDFRDALGAAIRSCGFPMGLLVTCNRVECYYWDTSGETADYGLQRVAEALGLTASEVRPNFYRKSGPAAAVHLMRVAGGLDSLVLGEDQILGQVGSAGRDIAPGKPGAHELAELFREAVRTGRRIRAGHRLTQDTSVAEAGVHWLARTRAGGLRGATVTVIGAGQMARLAAATLAESGVARLLLLNRSVEHAEQVLARLGRLPQAEARPLASLPCALRASDVVVGTTRSPYPVLTAEHLLKARNGSVRSDLLLLDLAAPRDFDPEVRQVPGVTLIDLDDLARVLGTPSVDPVALQQAEALAREGAETYARWLRVRAAAPAIVALRRHGDALLQVETDRLRPQLDAMAPAQREAVLRSLRRLTKQLLHGPTMAIREAAANGQRLPAADWSLPLPPGVPLEEDPVVEKGAVNVLPS
jgi:glutamyl-tRNA reductase